MSKYKPTSEEKKIIRQCAQRDAGFARVTICIGSRYNTEKEGGSDTPHLNVAFVTDHPDWDDTDLWDNAYTWRDFTRGIELTPDGRGIFDFWVYSTGSHGQLETNVQAYVEDGRLVRVDGTGTGVLWKAT